MIDFALTMLNGHDRMRLNRARSSMVEQWPFKPLVAGTRFQPKAEVRALPRSSALTSRSKCGTGSNPSPVNRRGVFFISNYKYKAEKIIAWQSTPS